MSASGTDRLQEALTALREMRTRLEAAERRAHEPLAVIGMGCRFPGGADSPRAYFEMLLAGHDAVADVSDLGANGRGYIGTRWAALLGNVSGFEPEFFDVSPREARRMDPQQRLLLEVAHEALERAGLTRGLVAGTRTGVYVGAHSYSDEYAWLQLREPHRIDAFTATGTGHSILANRISYCLDLRGPSVVLDTACSSSLVAVHAAVRALRAGECDTALAGGVNLMLTPEPTAAFARMRLLSPDGRCKTFDASADGIVRGEGCGVVVLKRLSDALAAGNPVLAVIRGSAVNQDGRSNGIAAPNGPAQEAVLREALTDAGVAAHEVGYIETHGTGTLLGDPIEVEALAEVVGREGRAPCWLGAVKTNVGHLEGAAGIAGLIKAVLAVHHATIPGNLHLRQPNPHLALDGTRLRLPAEPVAWAGERVAGVSSFGFGGTNAHVVVGSAPVSDPAPAGATGPTVLVVSARSPEGLRELAGHYQAELAARRPALTDAAWTAATRRVHEPERAAVVGVSVDEVVERLADLHAGRSHDDVVVGRVPAEGRRLVFVFSGQGGQHEGMARALLEQEPAFRLAVESCDEVFHQLAGWSLAARLTMEAPDLERASVAQPLLFAVQVGLAALWQARGLQPCAVVGHSLGEVAAAHVAGALPLAEAVRIVYHRGRVVETLAPEGAMAAVALTRDEAESLRQVRDGRVAIAGANAPGSLVLSGRPDAVHEVVHELERSGRFARLLALGRASHSPMMEDAATALSHEVRALVSSAARIPIFSSVTGGAAADGVSGGAYWGENLRQPVRFADAFTAAAATFGEGADFLEIGPHGVLVTPMRQCLGDVEAARVMASLDRDVDDARCIARVTAALHVRGHAVAWQQALPTGRVVELPTTPWVRRSFWLPPSRTPADLTAAPFPGTRLRSPALDAEVYEGRLAPAHARAFGEHRIDGREVAPAAVLLEVVRSALREVDEWALADVRFHSPLVVPEGGRVVQTVVRRRSGGTAVEVHAAADDGTWELVLSGEAVAADMDGAVELTGDDGTVDVDSAGVSAPPELRSIVATALDATLRAIAAAAAARDGAGASGDGGRIMLASFDRVDVGRIAAGPLVVRALAAAEGSDWVGDAVVRDASGRAVLRISGARLVSLDGASPSSPVLELTWQCRNAVDAPLAGERGLPEPGALAQGLDLAQVATADADLARAFFEELDALVAGWSAHAVAELLGTGLTVGTRIDDSAVGALGLEAHQRALLRRILTMLVDDGFLSRTEDGWEVRRAAPDDMELRADALAARFAERADALALVRRCGTRLAGVLRGMEDPLDLLFPWDGSPGAGEVYGDSVVSRQAHAVLGSLLARVAAARGTGGLRVLELGGGTGATTAAVLPMLPARRTDYVFTDVSRSFLERARERFAGIASVRCELLDIERSPVEQGFGAGSCDVVVASNVLHATRRLDESLAQVRTLLAPGGLLLLVEGVRPARWVDLVFGLTPGWWRFEGDPRRPAHALVDASRWRSALAAAGFAETEVVALPESGELGGFEQAILISRAAPAAAPVSVVSADTERAVWIAPAGPAADAAGQDVLRATVDACTGLMEAVRACGPGATLDVVTRGAQMLPGDAKPDPVHAAVWGLGRTLALENPDVRIGLIDLEPTTDATGVAAALRAFLAAPDDERQAAFRGGDRFVPRLTRLQRQEGSARIRRDGGYLIAGGTGELGLRLGEWLAERGAGAVVLASRRGAASSSARVSGAVERMRALGTTVDVVALNVADASAVAGAIARFGRELPPLRGVFHTAMPSGFGGLQAAGRELLALWLAAKVAGAWNLDRLTRAVDLDHFVLFSSVAGLWGARGMGPYAAANQFLVALSHGRHAQGLPALAIDWGGWSTGAVREADRFLERSDLRPLDPAAALAAMDTLMAGDAAARVVADADWGSLARSVRLGGLHRMLDELAAAGRAEPVDAGADGRVASELHGLAPAQAHARLTDLVRTEVADVLGMEVTDLVENGQGFFRLGMDSLTTLELRGRLQRHLGIELPTTVAFEHPTVDRLRDYLAGRLGLGTDADVTEAELAARLDAVLAGLEGDG